LVVKNGSLGDDQDLTGAAARFHRLARVHDRVEDDLLQLLGITQHRR